MCNESKYFNILKHGKLTKIFPDCYSIQGTMRLFGIFQYSRNMTILKNGDSLILINPVRLDEITEKELLKLGSIDHIFKIGSLHSIDVPYYMDKFSPKLWALGNDSSLPEYESDFILNDYQVLPFMDIKVHIFENSKIPEAILVLPTNGGIILSCDSLVNMTANDEHANFLVRNLSKLLPKPTYIGPNWVKLARPTRKSFLDILEFDFHHLVLAHGDPVIDNAKSELTKYFSTYKSWRSK